MMNPFVNYFLPHQNRFVYAVLLIVFMLGACQSVPDDIPITTSKQGFFNQAQEYMDALNWDAALFYLNEFKHRFPADPANILAADYQIALIRYKQELYAEALESFETILTTYEDNDSAALHEWVRVLSQKLIRRIQERVPAP